MSNELATRPAMTPMDLIQTASSSNASIEQMERLFSLQLQWEANEARKAFNQAFADFKAEGVRLVKTKRVHFTSQKGTTDYKHAELGYICDTVTPLMSRYGLSHSWSVMQDGGTITVTCKIAHSAGHSETTTLTATPDESGNKNKIQAVGSTITYLQRYSLLSALGLGTNESDDDGRGNNRRPEPEPIEEGDDVAYAISTAPSLDDLAAIWQDIPKEKRAKYTALKDEAKQRLTGGNHA